MINTKIKNIDYKNWHNENQNYLANDFVKQGYTVETEYNIPTPGGHKTRRRADIVVKDLNLIVEVQKSKAISKDFRDRCDDYKLAGYNVLWILHDNRWQPDSDENPELSNEEEDIFIKWRDYNPSLNRAQYIYNSNRFAIIECFHNNSHVDLMYCIQSGGQSGLMYRKVESTTEISRVLTPKFTDIKHFGSVDLKNHTQSPEKFKGYQVTTSIITKDTFKLKAT